MKITKSNQTVNSIIEELSNIFELPKHVIEFQINCEYNSIKIECRYYSSYMLENKEEIDFTKLKTLVKEL